MRSSRNSHQRQMSIERTLYSHKNIEFRKRLKIVGGTVSRNKSRLIQIQNCNNVCQYVKHTCLMKYTPEKISAFLQSIYI
ncbi:hypothetical protein BpHYR1_016742 [Brachionus plicatilis]|uniref:Uncharacterized protein n=1 Tax=Brachionus plicatilis TaxID=10195 RepID=A0A3M7Q142_BRAPC|nr:hypothetical protein BpHYR1_016742 [Brachionus plicatilis]